MKFYTIPAIVLLSISFISACAPMPRTRGNLEHNLALGVGIGLGAGLVNAISTPRHQPGYKVDTLPKGARSIEHHGVKYLYADGLYYRHIKRKYRVVKPPTGLVIHRVPPHANKVVINHITYYVAEGVYYRGTGKGFTVVAEPVMSSYQSSAMYEVGKLYNALPTAALPVVINGIQYFAFKELYFLPQSLDGKVRYLAITLN